MGRQVLATEEITDRDQVATADFTIPEAVTEKAPRGPLVRSPLKRDLMTFLMVLGPGLIVMVADNDAGAVSTYVQAGAQFSTHLLWILIILLPATYFVQEMVVRLGIATGQGHAAMIYNRFGKWWGRFSLIDLLLINFLTLVTEFAAIALALSQLNVSMFISVPCAALLLIGLVTTGSYLRWERMTVGLCLLDLTWLALAYISYPPDGLSLKQVIVPHLPPSGLQMDLVYLVIAIVGTTVAPWQLFFQQSCIADKRLRFTDLKWSRLDTLFGASITISVAGCMMLVGALGKRHNINFENPAQLATALGPIAGYWVRTAILMLMVNAALLGATAISLSSSWAYGEVMGWTHSLQKKVSEAPAFYAVYIVCISMAGAIVLIPHAPLQLIIIGVQVLAGLMLPSAIIFLQLLLNDKALLNKRFINKRWNNIVNWIVIILLFALSLVLAIQVVLPKVFA